MNETDAFLVELKLLVQKSDLDLILFLKDKLNVSETELRSVGFIVLSSLRNYC